MSGLFSKDKFQFPELITTLLYASAVSTMMSFSIKEKITIPIFYNTIIIILLVFADWHNRILTPLNFPKEDQDAKQRPFFQFAKISFEVIGMYCLVVFFSFFINIKQPEGITFQSINKYWAFAGYLSMGSVT
jgi:hypothetical protein